MENSAPSLPAAETDEPSLSVLPDAPNAGPTAPDSAADSPLQSSAPAKRKGRVLFTKETAKAMALRAQEARKRNKQIAADARKISGDSLPPGVASERLGMLCEQIARTQRTLNGKLAPRDRAQLLLALDRLLERERILRGIPLPGSRRPGRERPQTSKPGAVAQGPLD